MIRMKTVAAVAVLFMFILALMASGAGIGIWVERSEPTIIRKEPVPYGVQLIYVRDNEIEQSLAAPLYSKCVEEAKVGASVPGSCR